MEGYKRVRFADICRLCATNRGCCNIDIFSEVGLKRKLQNKLILLLNIEVYAYDKLPKVICKNCLRRVEDLHEFWSGCKSAENTLTSLYQKAQNIEYFKDTGMVYLKNQEFDVIHNYDKDDNLFSDCAQDDSFTGNIIMDNTKEIVQKIELTVPKESESSANITNLGSNLSEASQTFYLQVYDENNQLTNAKVETINATTLSNNSLSYSNEVEDGNTSKIIIKKSLVRNYGCQKCGKQFEKRGLLYQHSKLHIGERPFKCYCGKAFVRKEHLLRHEVLHSGEKVHTCDICKKSFARRDNLLKHRRIHVKVVYLCDACPKKFVQKHVYERHRQKTHKL